MKRLVFIFLIFFVFIGCYAQKNQLKKIRLEFEMFKFPNSEYEIDFEMNELSCKEFYGGDWGDTIFFNRKYKFTKEASKKLIIEFNKNIPDSILRKAESALDGGGFTIDYFKNNGTETRLDVTNPFGNDKKYIDEYNKLHTFFEFAYSVVKDERGIQVIDNSYRPYFRGLPVRKVSDSPLEYKVWGSISGNMSTNHQLKDFLEGLPKDKCVIINCADHLSYAIQEDILRLYIINDSNLKFVNNGYLKYTRENLIEVRDEVERSKKDDSEFQKEDRNSVHLLYFSNPEYINKWLELPESQLNISIEDVRRGCQ